jgi:hypothetical protein
MHSMISRTYRPLRTVSIQSPPFASRQSISVRGFASNKYCATTTSLRTKNADSTDAVACDLPARLYELEHELQDAIRAEDYKRAATLRDLSKATRKLDAVAGALDDLDAAVLAEDFDRAAAARDRLAAAIAARSASSPTAACSVNRLLVVTNEGGLLTCNPDGHAVAWLGEEADRGRFAIMQPTWNPSGDIVAVTRADTRAADAARAGSEVVLMWALGGAPLLSAPAPFVPFYLSWGPGSRRLAYLTTFAPEGAGGAAAGPRGVGLDYVRVFSPAAGQGAAAPLGADGDAARTAHVEDGAPLFYRPRPPRPLPLGASKWRAFEVARIETAEART